MHIRIGDPMVLVRAIGAAEYAASKGMLMSFCEENGLRHKAVVEIRKLRQQLTNEINLNMPGLNLIIDPKYVLYICCITVQYLKYCTVMKIFTECGRRATRRQNYCAR